jgi:hypothetical protein
VETVAPERSVGFTDSNTSVLLFAVVSPLIVGAAPIVWANRSSKTSS